MGDITIYEGPGGTVEVRVDRETVWLTQRQMAELFDSSTDNVGLHLKNIYTDGELEEPATTDEYSVVQQEGGRQVRRDLKHYKSGHHYFGRLSGKFPARCAFSPVGDPLA